MFQIGQKVVCVDASDDAPGNVWQCDAPREGEVYSITGILPIMGTTGLVLAEIKNSPWFEYAYRASRFRPVVERKTSTGFAILEEIRRKHSKKNPVRA